MKRVGFSINLHLNCVEFMIPGDVPENEWFDWAATHGYKEAIIKAIESNDWYEIKPWPEGEDY